MSTAPAKPQAGYSVARPLGKCTITGQEIAVGEKFMAALRETPTGLERLDISMGAWEQFDRRDLLAFWQATMPATEQKKKLFVDDETLQVVFDRLADTQEPNKQAFRFVLGLVLMRKRLLSYESSRVEGENEIWTVKAKGREERIDLINPHLDEQRIADVTQQLGEILNEEL
jgi:hypothetical protein